MLCSWSSVAVSAKLTAANYFTPVAAWLRDVDGFGGTILVRQRKWRVEIDAVCEA